MSRLPTAGQCRPRRLACGCTGSRFYRMGNGPRLCLNCQPWVTGNVVLRWAADLKDDDPPQEGGQSSEKDALYYPQPTATHAAVMRRYRAQGDE